MLSVPLVAEVSGGERWGGAKPAGYGGCLFISRGKKGWPAGPIGPKVQMGWHPAGLARQGEKVERRWAAPIILAEMRK
jgi:hypothetical protein